MDIHVPEYKKTRQFILSSRNPWWSNGGIGSPHTNGRGHPWHLAMIMEGWEDHSTLDRVLNTAYGGSLHESVTMSGGSTRKWFGWANALFSEWLMQTSDSVQTSTKVFKKTARNYWYNGLDALKTSKLEYDALKRLESVISPCQHYRFPKVIKLEGPTISTTSIGTSLDFASDEQKDKISNVDEQLKCILSHLKQAKVRHLDIKCGNMGVENGILKMLDFGISTIDHNPLSSVLKKMDDEFMEDAKYETFLKEYFKKCINERKKTVSYPKETCDINTWVNDLNCRRSTYNENYICTFNNVGIDNTKIKVSFGMENTNDVMGRNEMDEYPIFTKGAFYGKEPFEFKVTNKNKNAHLGHEFEKYDARLSTLMNSYTMKDNYRGQTISGKTLAIMRHNYANPWWTINEVFLVWLAGVREVDHILFLDGHSKSSMDEFWTIAFGGNIISVGNLKSPVIFEKLFVVSDGLGLNSPLSPDFHSGKSTSKCQTNIFEKFVTYILRDISPVSQNMITLIDRKAYVRHPRGKTMPRVWNNCESEENTLRQAGYNVKRVRLETLSIREQLEQIRATSTLISVHGAGLAWLLFLPSGSKIIEAVPSSRANRRTFETASTWRQHITYERIPTKPLGNDRYDTDIIKHVKLETQKQKNKYDTPKKLPNFRSEKTKKQQENHELCILIPFRDKSDDVNSQGSNRENNLKEWLQYMSGFLKFEATVYIVEQTKEGIFNKGWLFNIGFKESEGECDYIVLHDVDQIPMNKGNNYFFRETPTKLIYETKRNNHIRKLSRDNVGGALMITRRKYQEINGYSNNFGGWGREDDNMALRLKKHGGYDVQSADIGHYEELEHARVMGLDETKQFHKNVANTHDFTSGLSNLKYEIIASDIKTYKLLHVKRMKVRLPTLRKARLFQVFPMNHELLFLEFRLRTTCDATDMFVIHEAEFDWMFRHKKRYAFEKRHFFESLCPGKIVWTMQRTHGNDNGWAQNAEARNSIIPELEKQVTMRTDDIICLFDADEVPTVEALAASRKGPYPIKMKLFPFKYGLFWRYGNGFTAKTSVQRFGSITTLYDLRHSPHVRTIENAGWHFSWVGSTKYIIQKAKQSHAADGRVGDDAEKMKPSFIDKMVCDGHDWDGSTHWGKESKFINNEEWPNFFDAYPTLTDKKTRCQPHLTIIIPFRENPNDAFSQGSGREQNLRDWTKYMCSFLPDVGRTNVDVRIIEQTQQGPFNKGALFNVGYHLSKNTAKYLVLHDVDHIPEKKTNDYRFRPDPTHMCVRTSQFGYANTHHTSIGGALMLTTNFYKSINGYSNNFLGWGGEDNNMYMRIGGHVLKKLSPEVGRYKALDHKRTHGLDKTDLFRSHPGSDKISGVSDVKWRTISSKETTCGSIKFTRTLVDFNVHKLAIIIPFRSTVDKLAQGGPDRERNLNNWLEYMSTWFKIPADVFVIEQSDDGRPFNKGALFNVGYDLTKDSHDYMIFHDVDCVPLDVENTYEWKDTPTVLRWHWSRVMDENWNAGGVLQMTHTEYKNINGYSNIFWGWGFEDTNMALRIKSKSNFNQKNFKYRDFKHDRVPGLHKKWNKQYAHNKRQEKIVDDSGISDIKYAVLSKKNINAENKLKANRIKVELQYTKGLVDINSQSQYLIKTSNLFAAINYNAPENKGPWKQGLDYEYDGRFKDGITIHVVPHSHNDPGWIKTYHT